MSVPTDRKRTSRIDDIEQSTAALLAYCRERNWAGYDPYDALNSKLFSLLPPLDSRIPRLVLTQALKRSPLNFRPLLQIPETQNPKALALFLSALVRMPVECRRGKRGENLLTGLIEGLTELRSPRLDYWAWGYSFPWQTRTQIVPRGTPNLVCTAFVANALLDGYAELGEPAWLEMAFSSADYIVSELYRSGPNGAAGFSYPLPSFPPHVHNANLIAAALLGRVFRHTGDRALIGPALAAARWSASRQRDDGSWPYGEGDTQQWIDNFHTGYNLGALREIGQYFRTTEFDESVRRGYEFYRAHFVREDGIAPYFHDRVYPIDIHCVAQTILTLLQFGDRHAENLDLAYRVFAWARENMWDATGFFHYRVLRAATIRIPYMRWSQAWMLLALSTLLQHERRTLTCPRELEAALLHTR
jgi:hypothetical protein